jgi:hypothetical protein
MNLLSVDTIEQAREKIWAYVKNLPYRMMLKEEHCRNALKSVADSIPEIVHGIPIVGKRIPLYFPNCLTVSQIFPCPSPNYCVFI